MNNNIAQLLKYIHTVFLFFFLFFLFICDDHRWKICIPTNETCGWRISIRTWILGRSGQTCFNAVPTLFSLKCKNGKSHISIDANNGDTLYLLLTHGQSTFCFSCVASIDVYLLVRVLSLSVRLKLLFVCTTFHTFFFKSLPFAPSPHKILEKRKRFPSWCSNNY